MYKFTPFTIEFYINILFSKINGKYKVICTYSIYSMSGSKNLKNSFQRQIILIQKHMSARLGESIL